MPRPGGLRGPATAVELAGRLNKVVTLEKPTETGGHAVVTWTVVATVWAEMLALGGAETSGVLAEANYRFRIRFRTDITPRWRIGYGTTRKFNILAVQDPDGREVELLVTTREIV
jgi:SPP1 family predicted phage head-tail adaptor